MTENEDVVFNYKKIVMETPKAWLVETYDNNKFWVPKSQIKRNRGRKTIRMPKWLMEKITKKELNNN